MKRIYHHFKKWEEYHAGMWRNISKEESESYLKKAIEFTGNDELYGIWMLKVIDEWPISCEQSLTNSSMNQLAWVGHAACCMAISCPEYITRLAWGMLTQEQRDKADQKALQAVTEWRRRQNAKTNYVLS